MASLIIMSAGMFCGFACAEEAGSGHYQPGATSSFIDMLPDRGTSTFAYLKADRMKMVKPIMSRTYRVITSIVTLTMRDMRQEAASVDAGDRSARTPLLWVTYQRNAEGSLKYFPR
jgi:hypothetical protein